MERQFTEEEHQACAASLGLESMPPMFTQAILEARANGAPKTPVVIAEFPSMTREEHIRTLPENHPARIAQEKKEGAR